MKTYELKDLVKENVKFLYYQKKELWYETDQTHFVFSVPIEDCGDGRFLAQDKGIIFMRYLRKYLEDLKKGI